MKISNQLSAAALTILLLSTAGLMLVESVKANGFPDFPELLPVNHGYIKSNGDIDPPTLPIEHSGNTYTLRENIVNYSITIQKDNAVFDGNGFSISTPSYGEKGANGLVKSVSPLVQVSNCTNVTVKNFLLQNSGEAIGIWDSSKITILQNRIINCGWIYFGGCTQCSILNNSMINNMYGLYGSSDSYFDIENNQINGSISHGIVLQFLNYSNIVGNVFVGNGQDGICYLGSYNRVVGNVFQDNGLGIFSLVGNNEIYHNNFIDNNFHDIGVNYPNTLDDGNEGNYWSKHPSSTPYEITAYPNTSSKVNVDHYPQVSPYYISVVLPELEHSPTSSQTPTPIPTSTTTLTPKPVNGFFNSLSENPLMATTAIVMIIFAIAGVSLIVYFKKRKQQDLQSVPSSEQTVL